MKEMNVNKEDKGISVGEENECVNIYIKCERKELWVRIFQI